ncbi:glutathione S-transferase family protein [Maritalea mediterranea]|uniref:Glutathione S-transferase family protein n=1 Tax=Maritalea mediterranea TaxID=2909667 RepID=A0ABS9E2J8_9HYPH|nr:glutathione S-transferase family protein [Maritalea mediterranea]MCF4097037.1 glutathione S-transferase family protein [Maritalea mediterranea]
MLIKGEWQGDWHPYQQKDKKGGFVRQESSFRHWITADGAPGPTGEGGFKAEADRYHLYVALICPWASRTLMARALQKLEEVISVSVVNPQLSAEGWAFGGFEGADEDVLNGATYMHQIYTKADPHYTGRATVPVLWDKKRQTIVNNESADILRMLNQSFSEIVPTQLDLYPDALASEIDVLNDWLYHGLNNGVYRAGFAQSQEAYAEAFDDVFATLEKLEDRLAQQGPYLFGDQLTESDIRLFVTLARFDVAYYGLFKTNLKRVQDYPHLLAFCQKIYGLDGVANTVKLDHIKAGYYSVKALNPHQIIPAGPIDVGFVAAA